MSESGIVFGTRVRILDVEVTRRSGHANQVGICYGLTAPSVSTVPTIGEPIEDRAFHVHFDAENVHPAWFAEHLVIPADEPAELRATLGGRTFIKNVSSASSQQDSRPEGGNLWRRRRRRAD